MFGRRSCRVARASAASSTNNDCGPTNAPPDRARRLAAVSLLPRECVKTGQKGLAEKAAPQEAASKRHHEVAAASSKLAWRRDGPAFNSPAHLIVEILEPSPDGAPLPSAGDLVEVHYSCIIGSTGCCVDASRSKAFSDRAPYKIRINENGDADGVVPGMGCGVLTLPLGSLARLHVPSRHAYGPHQSGPIKPNTDLVFEVEVIAINGRHAPPRDPWRLRSLLMLPPPYPLPGSSTAHYTGPAVIEDTSCYQRLGGEAILIVQQAGGSIQAAYEEAERTRRYYIEAVDPEAIGQAALLSSSQPAGGGRCDGGAAASVLPTWLTRLRSAIPLPTPECTSYYAFARVHDNLLRKLREVEVKEAIMRKDGTLVQGGTPTDTDLGPKLIPGATYIPHVPYGTYASLQQRSTSLSPPSTPPHTYTLPFSLRYQMGLVTPYCANRRSCRLARKGMGLGLLGEGTRRCTCHV